jgi:hypothetical protein
MPREKYRNNRLFAVFLLGWFLLGYPLLSLFDAPALIWGVPLLYAYIFLVWLFLIILIILTIGSRPPM